MKNAKFVTSIKYIWDSPITCEMLKTYESEGEKCASWKDHYAKYRETRLAYKDKNRLGNCENTLFLSADMHKVILLPRLSGYKMCLLTKRTWAFNGTKASVVGMMKMLPRPLSKLWTL